MNIGLAAAIFVAIAVAIAVPAFQQGDDRRGDGHGAVHGDAARR